MVFSRKLIFNLLIIIPVFSFCKTNSDCSDVTISSASVNGSYVVNSYLESDGIRDGNDYYGSTIYYPENTSGLLPSIIIIPGYANPQLSIQTWGPFLASHGIVCMTIGTNSIWDEVLDRKIALKDALISLKAEHIRVGSILFNRLDTNLIALGGWSMGGGGAQLVAAEDSSIKAILAFCPWIDPAVISPALLNHNTPILFFSGQIDAVAPPSTHTDVQYNYTPSSTKKLKYEVLLGGHTIANNPMGGFGEVGRMGVSWLKKYLVNDSCYCPLLLSIPTTASNYITNIDCYEVSPSWDCDNNSCSDPGTGNGQYSTLDSCLLDSCSVTTNTINYPSDILLYPNPSNNVVVLKGVPNNSIYHITSVGGNVLMSKNLSGNKIDVSNLKNGLYFLECNSHKMKLLKN
tara:strand:- start:3734 stop:4942 length:1209 start_codon:yes stop_codon:yes gene_type:complete